MTRLAALGSIRPPFLILTPACILTGIGTAAWSGFPLNLPECLLILLCALFAHISVNALNEYQDFDSGLDLQTERTPFSGGSGTLPANPHLAAPVKLIALLSLLATLASGLYLARQHLLAALPLGLIGVLLIISYTRYLNRSALLCLIAPGLAFGPLFVIGTHLVLTGEYSLLSLSASVPIFFLVNNLLLLNQYPDIRADRLAGRRHLPIRFGISVANAVYALFSLAAYGVLLIAVSLGQLPGLTLMVLLALPFSLIALFGALRYGEGIGAHTGFLASNVAASILAPSLLGIALLCA